MAQAQFYYKDKGAPQSKGNRIGTCILLEYDGKLRQHIYRLWRIIWEKATDKIEQKFLRIMKRSCILKSGGGDYDFVCRASW